MWLTRSFLGRRWWRAGVEHVIFEATGDSPVQPHRLRALIVEDLERFPNSAKGDIRRRVGPEIPERTFRRALEELVSDGQVEATGETRARTYRAKGTSGHGGDDVQ